MKNILTVAILLVGSWIGGGCVSTSREPTRAEAVAYINKQVPQPTFADASKYNAWLDEKYPNEKEPTIKVYREPEPVGLPESKTGYSDYCKNKKQIKTFTVTKSFIRNIDSTLNTLQQMMELKNQARVAEDEVRKHNYGVEGLKTHYFFPKQKDLERYLEYGSAYNNVYSQDQCNSGKREILRDADGLAYCQIKRGGDPLSIAMEQSTEKYLTAHKNIKQVVKGNQINFLITYDLEEYCAKAIPVSDN